MINIEKNEENFKRVYEYYKRRIQNVIYPPEEIEKIYTEEQITKEEATKQQRIKMLKLKYEHTKRVVEMIKKMNIIMNHNELFQELSQTAGLLHDYGRFIQAVYHNSYLDAEKFYKNNGYNGHGEVGYKLLFELDEIRNFDIDKKYYELLGPVIKYHQLSKLEDSMNLKIDEHFNRITEENISNNKSLIISCMLQMVRDADKYDILYQRLTNEYPILSNKFTFHVNNMTIEEISKITGVEIDEILKWNNLKNKDITGITDLKMPLQKVNPEILEVPEKIKQKFFQKVYMQNTKEWDLYSMQNDKTYNYNSITAMWWTIGQFLSNINFTSTLIMMKEEQLLEQIYALYPDKYKYLVKDMFEFAIEELLEKRINPGKIYAKKNI